MNEAWYRLQPCTKFKSYGKERQLKKIHEEVKEVNKAYARYKASYKGDREKGQNIVANLAEELVDLQTACETMMYILGYSEIERDVMRRRVNLKNVKREYVKIEEE